MKVTNLHYCILLLFAPLITNGQILNIERLRLEKDTVKNFQIKTTFGLNSYNRSAAETNPVNLFGYNLDLNAIYYPGKHAYMLLTKLDYLRINEDDFLNFGFVHGRINFFRERRLSYELFGQYSYDNFRGLDPRLLLGGSVRYNIVKSDNLTLLFGTGLMYEAETWQHPHTQDHIHAHFLKSSSNLNLRYTLNEYVDLNVVNYYQVGYDPRINKLRNRVNSSVILNTRLSSWLSWKNSFDMAYEDKPLVPITKMIYSLNTGLSFDM